MTNEILLILVAFGTATLTAITGIGGGMILIAIMPGLLPAAAIIPVHAAVQMFSNLSRALFGWRFMRWEFVLAFVGGAIGGGLIAAGITREINLAYTPLFIAAYILFTVWGPRLRFPRPVKGEFVAIGFVQTGLSMIVGATGPMGQAAMLHRGLQRDALVVTSAFMMTLTHLIKIVMFALLGFAFLDYWKIIAGMAAGVILGALLGTHIRYRVPETLFRQVLKWLLTLLALRMIVITFT
ncbi:MAG: sulfite exporter TauE/SafE family protein [Gammaproteobacteria bacterium]|nr:sulfite exporter TauE/SafE family protein [Gammaproteobacteria bacterium]MDH3447329.1 sulfite exporter TauE/SafE family protein [Gammaproteobacteria bacterium]